MSLTQGSNWAHPVNGQRVKLAGLGPRLVAGEARDGGGIGIPPPASKTATEGLYA